MTGRKTEVAHDLRFLDNDAKPLDGIVVQVCKSFDDEDDDKKNELETFYGYFDQGRLLACDLDVIKSYVESERRNFQSRVRGARGKGWQKRFTALAKYACIAYPDTTKRKGTKRTDKHPHSFKRYLAAQEKSRGKKLTRRAPLHVGYAYEFWLDAPLAYILIDPDDKAATADYYPFNGDSKSFGAHVADWHLHLGEVATIEKNGMTLVLSPCAYALLPKLIDDVAELDHRRRLYRNKVAGFVRGQAYIKEALRVFELNEKPHQPAQTKAIAAARAALKQQNSSVKTISDGCIERVQLLKASKKAFSWLKSGTYQKWDTDHWRKHEGSFGPTFVIGMMLRLLRDGPISEDVGNFLKPGLFEPSEADCKKPQPKVVTDPNTPFLLLDEKRDRDNYVDWFDGNTWSWLHKSLTVATDAYAGYTYYHMLKTTTATLKKLKGGNWYGSSVIMSRILGTDGIKDLFATTKRTFSKLDCLAEFKAAQRFQTTPMRKMFSTSHQTLPDKIDDLYAFFQDLGNELQQDLHKFSPGARAQVDDAIRTVNREFQEASAKSAKKGMRGTEIAGAFRLLASGIFLFCLGAGAHEEAEKNGLSEAFYRASVDALGQLFGFVADVASTFPKMPQWIRGEATWRQAFRLAGTTDATSTSRMVGASRVFGVLASLICLGIASYDLGKAIGKGDWERVAANTLVTIGASICLTGFYLDGCGAVPVGIWLNVTGTVMMVIGSMWDAGVFDRTKSEGMRYLIAIQAKSKDFYKLPVHQYRQGLIDAINTHGSYARIPRAAFIHQPKARAVWLDEGRKDIVYGEHLKYRIETLRLENQSIEVEVLSHEIWEAGHEEQSLHRNYHKERFTVGKTEMHTGMVDTGAMLRKFPKMLNAAVRTKGPKGTASNDSSYLFSSPRLIKPEQLIKIVELRWASYPTVHYSNRIAPNKKAGHSYRWLGNKKAELNGDAYLLALLEGPFEDVIKRALLKAKVHCTFWESDYWTDEKFAVDETVGSTMLVKKDGNDCFLCIPLTSKALGSLAVEPEALLQIYATLKIDFFIGHEGPNIGTIKPIKDMTKYLLIEKKA